MQQNWPSNDQPVIRASAKLVYCHGGFVPLREPSPYLAPELNNNQTNRFCAISLNHFWLSAETAECVNFGSKTTTNVSFVEQPVVEKEESVRPKEVCLHLDATRRFRHRVKSEPDKQTKCHLKKRISKQQLVGRRCSSEDHSDSESRVSVNNPSQTSDLANSFIEESETEPVGLSQSPTTESFPNLKNLLLHYFFRSSDPATLRSFVLSPREIQLLKVLFEKKLICSTSQKTRSLINSIGPQNYAEVICCLPQDRRKNVIKGLVFRMVWKFLSQFEDIIAVFFENDQSFHYHRNRINNNLHDDYYLRCFARPLFRQEFFSTLRDARFEDFILVQSIASVEANFPKWITRLSLVLDGSARAVKNIHLPITKYEMVKMTALFTKLLRKLPLPPP